MTPVLCCRIISEGLNSALSSVLESKRYCRTSQKINSLVCIEAMIVRDNGDIAGWGFHFVRVGMDSAAASYSAKKKTKWG
jgi:hypothetical protein